MRLTPSAPASSQALATAAMSAAGGGELQDKGLFRHSPHRPRHRRGGVRRRAEGGSAAVDVGAGDVDLDPAHLHFIVQPAADLGVLVDGKAADVRHHRLAEDLLQPGQLMGNHRVDAGVLQSHGVQQTAGVLRDTGGGVAEAGLAGRPLEGEGAQYIDVVELGKFLPEAEGAAGGDNGVVQRETAEGHRGIHHMISSFTSTGPSVQMRLLPYFVRQEQPMHAPKPQPMRSSKLNCPEVAQRSYTAWSIGSGPQV